MVIRAKIVSGVFRGQQKSNNSSEFILGQQRSNEDSEVILGQKGQIMTKKSFGVNRGQIVA